MRIKLDLADVVFSGYIRRRDKRCVRCLQPGTGEKGIVGLQCSHYFGRGRESVRFDPENCDALCYGCHQFWGSTNREDYRAFKIKQLGKRAFDLLCWRAEQYKKKDRKLALLLARALLKTL